MRFITFFNSLDSWKLIDEDYHDVSNILSALRGPDSNSAVAQELKEIVTTRLRFIVSKRFSGDMTSAPLTAYDVQTVKRIAGRMQRRGQQRHFLEHLQWAVQATVQHPVWDGLGPELVSAICG